MLAREITRDDIKDAIGAFYDPSEFEVWFSSPQAVLHGQRPCVLLAAGRGADILRAIGHIKAGAALICTHAGRPATADYRIDHCTVRERWGLPAFAILKRREAFVPTKELSEVWDGVSVHHTRAEAEAALAAQMAGASQSGGAT